MSRTETKLISTTPVNSTMSPVETKSSVHDQKNLGIQTAKDILNTESKVFVCGADYRLLKALRLAAMSHYQKQCFERPNEQVSALLYGHRWAQDVSCY